MGSGSAAVKPVSMSSVDQVQVLQVQQQLEILNQLDYHHWSPTPMSNSNNGSSGELVKK